MQGNRAEDTRPEVVVRSAVHALGLRFRKHVAPVRGLRCRADLVFASQRVVVFVDSFRHTVASRGLLAGESVDEIAFLLGHRDGNVTRAVYVREVADARRRAMRRDRMAAEFTGVLDLPIPVTRPTTKDAQLRLID
jgi:integrase